MNGFALFGDQSWPGGTLYCALHKSHFDCPRSGKMGNGMMTFLVATGAATAWLLLMRRSQNRRVRRTSGGSDAGGYASDSDWFGHSSHSADGCSAHGSGHGDSGGGDCGGGGDGGGD
jgi:hypothetical protein